MGDFFDHVYAPMFKKLGAVKPRVKPVVQIKGGSDAKANIAQQLGCKPKEVQAELQLIQDLIVGRMIPTELDYQAIRDRMAREQAKRMQAIRQRVARTLSKTFGMTVEELANGPY